MSGSRSSSTGRIVVGVDGSAAASAALRWAVSQAEVTGETVQAVIAWQYPMSVAGCGWAPVVMDEGVNLENFAEKTLAEAVDQVATPGSGVTIERRVVEGYAPNVLLGAAADADLLVVGSRGHGAFADALLGSVSQHCAHHARCPVVIVRAPA
jgi:nucleotide-binding universal stress UspA family protein